MKPRNDPLLHRGGGEDGSMRKRPRLEAATRLCWHPAKHHMALPRSCTLPFWHLGFWGSRLRLKVSVSPLVVVERRTNQIGKREKPRHLMMRVEHKLP